MNKAIQITKHNIQQIVLASHAKCINMMAFLKHKYDTKF